MSIITAFNVLARENRPPLESEIVFYENSISSFIRDIKAIGLTQEVMNKVIQSTPSPIFSNIQEIKRSAVLINTSRHFLTSKMFKPKAYCGSDEEYRLHGIHIQSCNFNSESSVRNGDVCRNYDDLYLEFDFDRPISILASIICMYFRVMQFKLRDDIGSCITMNNLVSRILDNSTEIPVEVTGDSKLIIENFKFLYGTYLLLSSNISERSLSPYWRTHEIFSANSAKSIVSHKNAYINNMCLGEEFSKEVVCTEAIMKELYNSPLVDKEFPENSRFFTCLTEPGRPMHGVFNVSELKSILEWFQSGDVTEPSPDEGQIVNAILKTGNLVSCYFKKSLPDILPEYVNERALYHRLVQGNTCDATIIESRQTLISNFARASQHISQSYCKPGLSSFPYSSDNLSTRLTVIHKNQEEIGELLASIDFCPETLRRIHIAASPIMPVDGVWLEFLASSCFANPFNRDLFAIYMDEIGAGNPRQNHARLWAEMIGELGLNLPHFLTKEFSEHQSIPSPSFTLANCMLAFSIHGREFFPELLGFNLSIELAGLGGTYTVIAKSMEHKGFPSEFWRVHSSVDNAISGHTFLSVRSIDRFMRSAENMSSSIDTTNHFWNRIWNGFVSHRLIDEDVSAACG